MDTNTTKHSRHPSEFTAEDHAVQDALVVALALLKERGFHACVTVTLANGREVSRDNH